jgi:tryptophan synthase beta chain
MKSNNSNTIEIELQKEVKKGYFGNFGGMFVPPVLEPKLLELSDYFDKLKDDDSFNKEFHYYLKQYVGRPSPLYYAKRLSEHVGSRIYLKREDLNHTGAHKINNTIGQILVAKAMGAKEIIAETGAGQHGVATATAAALFGMKCKIFMGKKDAERQQLNEYRIRLLGSEFVTTERGTATLKDAVDAALEYYVENPDSYYLLGSAVGPHPYPTMVRTFQSIIGTEAREQIFEQEGKLPESIFACVGGGSNAIGLFSGFIDDEKVRIHAAEGGGEGLILGKTASTLQMGTPMVFQGAYSYCIADKEGNPIDTNSIAAGLDYPGVGPEHADLKEKKRAEYHCVTDKEAVDAFKLLSALEGIIPAIESAHAVALAIKLLKNKNELSIINISGRGDKDVDRNLI